MLLKLSLLPIGVFFLVWKAFGKSPDACAGSDEGALLGEAEVGNSTGSGGGSPLLGFLGLAESCAGTPPKNDFPEEERPYLAIEENAKYCLGYALFLRAATFLSLAVSSKVRAFAASLKREAVKFALRHPVRFGSRLRRVLATLRWAKYLAPLIGTCNKLRGNTNDLLKKYRQRLAALRAEKKRKRLWRRLGPEALEEEAATLIQAHYRMHSTRRNYRVLRLFYLTKKEAAMLRIYGMMRSWAARARRRVREKEAELHRLQAKQAEVDDLSGEEKRKLYLLEHQIGRDVQAQTGRAMLIRPNTPFAVTWKMVFVVCVALEIAHKALAPRMARLKHKGRDGSLGGTGSVWEHHLVPEAISKWPECTVRESKDGLFGKMGKLKSVVKRGNDPSFEKVWYCDPPYSSIHDMYSSLVRFVVREILVIFGIICFADVFVTFFTGELCDKTGSLIPKPFMKRWLLPGILFQFAVNPMMADVRWALQYAVWGINHVGPARVWRWSVALIFPCARVSADWCKWNVWKKLVADQNKRASS